MTTVDVPTLVAQAREGLTAGGGPADLTGRGGVPATARGDGGPGPADRRGVRGGPYGLPGRGQVHVHLGAGVRVPEGRQARRRPGRGPLLALQRGRAPRRPGADVGPRLGPGGLHPLHGHPRPPGRPRVGRTAGDPGAGRGRLRGDPRRDGRRRAVGGRDRLAGGHLGGAAGARDGRRDPGRQGGHPGDRRRVRGEQGGPGRRGRHRPGAEPHAGSGRGPGPATTGGRRS